MILCTYIDVVISFLRLQVRVSEPKHNRSDMQLNLICERSELFMVKNVYPGFSSHTDGYIFFLHIVNTFRVTHLHTLLMKIFLT
jgi:hypothetical protein